MNFKIHGFEPSKHCYEKLDEKYKDNSAVSIIHKGVSDANEKLTLYFNTEGSGMASVYERNLFDKNLKLDKTEEIEVIKSSDYIKENNIDHIHFIKIDIEGHEYTAFKGLGEFLNPDFIDFIQFEYGGANIDSKTSLKEIYYLFLQHNFTLAKVMPEGLLIREYKDWMENFQNANYVAVSNIILKDFIN